MLASSWKAKGLVRAAWLRLDVPKNHREKLAELTGIPASNLSGMNTGRLVMTLESAQRIAAAVPGLSVLELGAPLEHADPAGLTLLGRLEEVAEMVANGFGALGVSEVQLRPDEDAPSRKGG